MGFREVALSLLEDGDMFADCVEEINSWNGAFSDTELFTMCEFDDLHYGMSALEIINRVVDDFNPSDEYFFYDWVGGLHSYNGSRGDFYMDNIGVEELVEELIYNYERIDLESIDKDLDFAIFMLTRGTK